MIQWIIFLNIIMWFFCCYMFVRGCWLHKKRKEFLNHVDRLITNNAKKKKYLKRSELNADIDHYLYKTLWSFKKSYFHFWILNFKKMVNIPKSFKEIEKFIEKSENNILLFKKKTLKNQGKQNASNKK